MTPLIAVVDDEPRMAQVLGMMLRRQGYEVDTFTDPRALLARFDEGTTYDLVLTDLKMPGMDGVALLGALLERAPEVPVILLTAHGTVRTATEAMRLGAFDFLEKPVDRGACEASVRRALEITRLARENRYLRAELGASAATAALPGSVIVASPAMKATLALATRAARARATVLIAGDSGTGKEVVARAIHFHSARVGAPFVAINCKALASGVLESELFGHVKGAFTGAQRDRAGVFERAHGGTLFLDEIGELEPDPQAKLLRVLQEREVVRVGGDRAIQVDVRVVAATNRDLRAEVAAGRFREDLFFRLAVIPITIAPLRERPEDILPLAKHFLARSAAELERAVTGWTPGVERALTAHAWPGNVRELENVMERAAVLAPEPVITVADLMLGELSTTPPRASARPEDGVDLDLQRRLDAATIAAIEDALEAAGGRRAEAASLLGVDRTTLYRLMKKHLIS